MASKCIAAFVIAVLTLALVASDDAKADLIINGGFEQTGPPQSGSFGAGSKAFLSGVQENINPTFVTATGWSTPAHAANGSGNDNLTFLDAPGTADTSPYLQVFSPFPSTSPQGGNFVQSDGDPNFTAPVTQTLTGLTPGHTYAVSFYQAAGQQTGFDGPTFERWTVGFGSSTQQSPVINLPSHGVHPWDFVTLNFKASSTSAVLSFLATGNSSVPCGAPSLPPIVFLDGVSVNDVAVPEPSTWLLTGLSLFGLGIVYLRQRPRRAVA
jgi:hypothetical protein